MYNRRIFFKNCWRKEFIWWNFF